jgi:hypothetical protein
MYHPDSPEAVSKVDPTSYEKVYKDRGFLLVESGETTTNKRKVKTSRTEKKES